MATDGQDNEPTPPVPIKSERSVPHGADGEPIPDNLVDDEFVIDAGDLTAMETGTECPRCGSSVFYHPESIAPPNTVVCFECQFLAMGYAWWETKRLDDFEQEDDQS